MNYLVAIDPGKRTGWAMFRDSRLTCCGYVLPDGSKHYSRCEQLNKIPGAETVLIEQPRWYPHERKIDVNDLLDLAVLVGEIKANMGGRCFNSQECDFDELLIRPEVELIFPRTWKGTVPKPIMSQRIYEKLDEGEKKLLPLKRGKKLSTSAADHDHNALDAIGLGLWKLGRL